MSKLLKSLIGLADTLDGNGEVSAANEVDGIIKSAIEKLSFVRRRGKWWVVLSRKGKELGRYKNKGQALARLRQIHYWDQQKDK